MSSSNKESELVGAGEGGSSLDATASQDITNNSFYNTTVEVPSNQNEEFAETNKHGTLGDGIGGTSSSDLILNRDQWDNPIQFLMSCISMSVGLGNVWRFPVVAYENGGGAFLVPYLIVLVCIGRPIYFMELILGQFSSYSQVKAWRVVPLFRGVGYAAMLSTGAVITYYVSIMGTIVYYFFASCQPTLPWTLCDEKWAGKDKCSESSNESVPEMYYMKEVMKTIPSIENGIGYPDWKLTGCLVLSWICVYACIARGVKIYGRVVYFTAIFPLVILLLLLIRGLSLSGAGTGILYFITPQWEKLLEPSVWFAAVTQCFYSLNTCFGSIIMMASRNNFNHNIYRDALIISFTDTFSSLLAGLTIFAVLGNLSSELGVDIDKVLKGGGASLVFVSYAEAISKFDWFPQIFSVLFFTMLFTLGLGSTIADVETFVTIICDSFPNLTRWIVTLLICIVGCGVGLVYTTPGGQFILDLVDFFGGTFVIFTVALLEVTGLMWIYGLYNYLEDTEFMLNLKLGWYWKISWGLVIPIFMSVVLVHSLITDITPTHNGVTYPASALICGWLLAITILASIPFGAFQAIMRAEGDSLKEKFLSSLKPRSSWGPMESKLNAQWKEFKNARPRLSFNERVRLLKL